MNRNAWIIGGVIVALLAVGGVYIALQQSNKPTQSSSNTSTNTQQSSGSQQDQQSSSTNKPVLLQTKSGASGSYFADGSGMPLYTYAGDEKGVSNCSGQCLADWPPYSATTTTNLPAHLSVISRSDGSKQYAYNDMPLYTFSGDSAGQPSGDGISNFFLAKP